MVKFFYVLTIIGALIGGFWLLMAIFGAKSAPQEAAAAAIAAACAIIPYVFARAVQEINKSL
ncbi:hypothetical protein BKE38_08665 [Pseudoroseomonas deserti]|uniref:Uncharacterized protein n=1 Tax=Teichococcus deserti TaxID=1817963 RepID=A0A1V2H3Y2_9PROT|nr:hypothetical protein [Pseudoroseomonas deserti]ONG55729.1 hypothetical protein BKE38_08665 [Pseudoroseomonas deserti]